MPLLFLVFNAISSSAKKKKSSLRKLMPAKAKGQGHQYFFFIGTHDLKNLYTKYEH